MKPKTVKDNIQPNLDQREMKQLMEGANEEAEEDGNRAQAEMIKGVGYIRLVFMLFPHSRRRERKFSGGSFCLASRRYGQTEVWGGQGIDTLSLKSSRRPVARV
jgi:hypothetical protein